jgi:hypothetical protein
LEYYKSLEDVTVIYNGKNDFVDSLQSTIDQALKETKSGVYAVTDSDIALVSPEKFQADHMIALLVDNPQVPCVGSMIEVMGLTDEKQLKAHMGQFWGLQPRVARVYNLPILYQFAFIDTTFAFYRDNFKFINNNQGMRLYWPFSVYHLDWYYGVDLPEDYIYYKEHCDNNISTYDGR